MAQILSCQIVFIQAQCPRSVEAQHQVKVTWHNDYGSQALSDSLIGRGLPGGGAEGALACQVREQESLLSVCLKDWEEHTAMTRQEVSKLYTALEEAEAVIQVQWPSETEWNFTCLKNEVWESHYFNHPPGTVTRHIQLYTTVKSSPLIWLIKQHYKSDDIHRTNVLLCVALFRSTSIS